MKNYINLFWFNRYINIGDLLGPWIINKIAKDSYIKYSTYVTKREALVIVLGAFKHFRIPKKEYIRRLFVNGSILFSIGSILDHCNESVVVWGSGFQNYGEKCQEGKFLAVRGYKSLARLKELGFNVSNSLPVGDPAILMPLLYKPTYIKKNKFGIIMHDSDREYIITNFAQYHLIDVVTNEVEPFIEDICSCEKILTTSMHGLILAHAYGIPALWIRKNWIGSDGFKFDDYFSSVGIEHQEPVAVDSIIGKDEEYIDSLFSRYDSIPKIDIQLIQKNLLNSAPFALKEEYNIQ